MAVPGPALITHNPTRNHHTLAATRQSGESTAIATGFVTGTR
ncbi:hypothetical protein ACQPZ2_21245 [Nocardia pseudovaccinii]